MIPLVVLLSVIQLCSSSQERNFGHERVVDNLLQNYGDSQRLVRPSVNTSASLGLTLAYIRSFNDKTGLLTATYWLKQKWTDERVAWEDKSVASVTFPITNLWRPDFRIFNSLEYKESLDMGIFPLVYQSGMVLWIPTTEHTTRCARPTDESDQWTCNIKAGSWTHNGQEVVLSLYENITTVDLEFYDPELNGWKVTPLESRVENKFYDCCPGIPYASIDFKFKISKVIGGVADGASRFNLSVLSLSAFMVALNLLF